MFTCPKCKFEADCQFPFMCRCGERWEDPQGNQKEFPSLNKQVWNLATSLTTFISDGMKLVSKEVYENRLHVCDSCDRRTANRCTECGCNLSLKAKGRAFTCPIGRWDV